MKTLAAVLLLALAGCAYVNKEAMAAWATSDKDMMADLAGYRAAAGKPADDIAAHNLKVFSAVTADEENLLMAELLADISTDPRFSDRRKASYPLKIQAHLNLFNSMKGN